MDHPLKSEPHSCAGSSFTPTPSVKAASPTSKELIHSLVEQNPFRGMSLAEQNDFIESLISHVRAERANRMEILRKELSVYELAEKRLSEIART